MSDTRQEVYELTVAPDHQVDGLEADPRVVSVSLFMQPGTWKSIIVVPEQTDAWVYAAVVREMVKATQSRVDVNALTLMSRSEAGAVTFVDFDLHPNSFVASPRETIELVPPAEG